MLKSGLRQAFYQPALPLKLRSDESDVNLAAQGHWIWILWLGGMWLWKVNSLRCRIHEPRKERLFLFLSRKLHPILFSLTVFLLTRLLQK